MFIIMALFIIQAVMVSTTKATSTIEHQRHQRKILKTTEKTRREATGLVIKV